LARVVARRRWVPSPRSAALQRMTLKDTGWLTSVAALTGIEEWVGSPRTVVGDPGRRKGKVYTEVVAKEAGRDRLAALQVSAERNANVGKTVDAEAIKKWGEAVRDPNAKWTVGVSNLDKKDHPRLDPFHYIPNVPFESAGVDGPVDSMLQLSFQHAKNYTGYVEGVFDSSHAVALFPVTMYDLRSEHALKDVVGGGRNPKFSNVHVATAIPAIDETSGDTHTSLDAYTKIAGEGARWQCVRKHAAKLQDNSIFYCMDGGTRWGVTFATLWGNWASVFGKAYDIEDAVVAAKIKAPRPAHKNSWVRVPVPSPAAKDYNLDPAPAAAGASAPAAASAAAASSPRTSS
jgi:hypothetical protein